MRTAPVVRVLVLLAVTCLFVSVHGAGTDRIPEFPDNVPVVRSCTSDEQCDPTDKCSPDGACVSGPAVDLPDQPVLPMSTTLTICFCMALTACTLALMWGLTQGNVVQFFSFPNHDPSDRQIFTLIAAVFFGFVVLVVVGFGIGIPLTTIRVAVRPEERGQGAPCTTLGQAICGAYMCDMRSYHCYNVCSSDAQCSVGFFCQNGHCITPQNMQKTPISDVSVVMITVVVAIMLCACIVCFSAIYAVVHWRDVEFDAPRAGAAGCAGMILVVLVIGVPLGLQRPMTTSIPVATDIPGYTTPLVVYWGVILIAVLIGTCCCCVAGAICFNIADNNGNNDVRERSPPVVAFIALSTCLVIALIFGLSIGLSESAVKFTSPGDGLTCSGHMECSPYFCDFENGRCRNECTDNDECLDSFDCTAGVCALSKDDSGLTARPLGGWATLGVTAASAVVLACVCALLGRATSSRYMRGERAFQCCTFWLIFTLVVMGTSLGLSRSFVDLDTGKPAAPTNFPLPAANETFSVPNGTCVTTQAIICEPYLCDIEARQCATRCDSNIACSDSSNCVDNKCVVDPDFSTIRDVPLVVPEWVTVIVAMTLPLACCIGVWCVGLTYLELPRRFHISEQLLERFEDKKKGVLFWSLAGVISFFVVLLVVIPPLANTHQAVPATPCGADYECPTGAVCVAGVCAARKGTSVSPGYAALIGILTGLGCTGCAVGLSFLLEKCTSIFEVDRRALGIMAITVFCITSLIFGASTGLSRRDVVAETNYYGGHAVNLTSVACQVPLATVCGAFYCDVNTHTCATWCGRDDDCREGAGCVNNKCSMQVLDGPMTPGWKTLIGLGASFVAVVLGCALSIYIFGGGWGMRMSYGVRIEVSPAVACVGIIFATVLVIVTWSPLDGLAVPVIPGATGALSTVACKFIQDSQCAPYMCNTGEGLCAAACAHNAECRDGYACEAGQCQPYDDSSLTQATTITVSVIGGLIVFVFIKPTLSRAYSDFWSIRARARLARANAEATALLESQAQKKLDHPIIIDVDPVAVNAPDASLPSPTLWALDPKYNSSIFETGFDQAMRRDATPKTPGADTPLLVIASPTQLRTIPRLLPDGPEVVPIGKTKLEPEDATKPAITPISPNRVGKRAPPGLVVRIPTEPLRTIESPPPPPRVLEAKERGLILLRHTEGTCSICMSEDATVRLAGRSCRHGYCDGCAAHALTAMLEAGQFPARCPGCRAETPVDPVHDNRSFIAADIIERLARRAVIEIQFARRFIGMQLLRAFTSKEVITCPVCSMLNAAPDWLAKERQKGKDKYRVECAECLTAFCGKCNVLYHGHVGLTCDKYAKKVNGGDASSTNSLIAGTSKPCPNCGMAITHYRGHSCHHIAPGSGCPNCGIHFCIVCLQRYPCSKSNHDLFCNNQCDCPTCPDCRPGRPCPNCDGGANCPSCSGRVSFPGYPATAALLPHEAPVARSDVAGHVRLAPPAELVVLDGGDAPADGGAGAGAIAGAVPNPMPAVIPLPPALIVEGEDDFVNVAPMFELPPNRRPPPPRVMMQPAPMREPDSDSSSS